MNTLPEIQREPSIWLLTRTDDVDYDETNGFVIVAVTEAEARAIACANTGGFEDSHIWVSPTVICRNIGTANEGMTPGVLLIDFRAG